MTATCKTSNVVYFVQYTKSNMQCVGETENLLHMFEWPQVRHKRSKFGQAGGSPFQ